jgi:2-hydroxy-6-oxonona-2,4-dienedioate hydrolase
MPQKYANVNGYMIRYLEAGSPDRKILILLHGLGASAERSSYVIPTLSKYFHLIIPDIIGFGYSDKPAVDYTLDFFIDFFKSFLDNLGISKASIIVSQDREHMSEIGKKGGQSSNSGGSNQ